MQWLIKIIFSVILLASFIFADNGDTGEVVQLPYGKLRGQDRGFYYSYESIPYAEPPIGDFRFESPREYSRNWEKEFDATRAPVVCMQWDQFTPGDDKLVGEEDCLFVNVYRPKGSLQSASLPVLVFIHGGCFMFGSPMANDHSVLMRHGRFIVVKFAYRVGPLGFLSTEDKVLSGNYGLKDQRLALKWIKRHIASFGGDTASILVMGFSAGGASVHYQILQPDFAHYAKAAVSLSGTAFSPWALLQKARTRAFELGRNLNCSNLETSYQLKLCLQKRNAQEIVRGVRNFLVFGYNPFTTFGPVVESSTVSDAILSATPEDIIKARNFSQIPWLVSYAAQDGGYNAAELLQKLPRREELIEELNDRWYDLAPYTLFFKDTKSSVEELDDYSMALKKLYLGDKEFSLETYLSLQRMYTDVLFKNGAEKAVRLHREFGTSPVFSYVYDNPSDVNIGTLLSQRNDVKFGSVHGDDHTLIFPFLVKQPREDELIISEKLLKMLENFTENSHELTYGNCKFVDNVGQKQLAITRITRDGCENEYLNNFP